jgi:hypothetical protein
VRSSALVELPNKVRSSALVELPNKVRSSALVELPTELHHIIFHKLLPHDQANFAKSKLISHHYIEDALTSMMNNCYFVHEHTLENIESRHLIPCDLCHFMLDYTGDGTDCEYCGCLNVCRKCIEQEKILKCSTCKYNSVICDSCIECATCIFCGTLSCYDCSEIVKCTHCSKEKRVCNKCRVQDTMICDEC